MLHVSVMEKRSVNFLDLPDDQLQKIFSYLDFKAKFKAELINKR